MRLSGLTALFACLILVACGKASVTAPRYDMPNTPGGRLCVNQCREARDYCREQCDFAQRRCMTAMQAQAIKDYEAYATDQFRMRRPLDLRPSDFERPEKCKPVSCLADCNRPYDGCFKSCGGQIVPTTSCQFLCF